MMFTNQNAHAKVIKLVFEVQFPGNKFKFGIIGNDFWSSTIWAIQVSYTELENPTKSEIQPLHMLSHDKSLSNTFCTNISYPP